MFAICYNTIYKYIVLIVYLPERLFDLKKPISDVEVLFRLMRINDVSAYA